MRYIPSAIFFLLSFLQGYSQSVVDSLKRELKNASIEEQVVLLNSIADYSLDYSLDEARAYARKSIELSQKTGNIREEAYSNKILGYAGYYESRYDSALLYFDKALLLYEKDGYQKGISDVYTAMGGVYNKKGEIQKALDLFNASITIDGELKHFSDQAKTYNSVGLIYLNINDYVRALDYFEKSADIFKTEGELDALANVYANFGNLYYDWGKNEEALTFYDHALEIFKQKGIPHKIAGILSNKGMVYERMNEYDTGYQLLEDALKINEGIGNRYGIFNCKGNMAIIKEKTGYISEALAVYYEIVKIAEEIGYSEGIVSTYNRIGRIETETGRYDRAKQALQKALQISLETGLLQESMNAYGTLAEMYSKTGRFEKASEHYKSYILFKDSIFKIESLQQITEFNTKYEVEKKEGEIRLLSTTNELQQLELEQQRNRNLFLGVIIVLVIVIGVLLYLRSINQKRLNAQLEFKNAQLHLLNTTKDKFFSIIAHDLKNPLSAFRQISESLSENIETIQKEELDDYLSSMKQSSKSLYELLQNLLEWSMSQTGKLEYKPGSVSVSRIVENSIGLVTGAVREKGLKLLNETQPEQMVWADEKMLGTIVRNLLTNAVKFSNANGEIRIMTDQKGGHVLLKVKDNGIGMSEDDIRKLFRIDVNTSEIGQSKEKGTGLGLILCKELAEINQGQIFAEGKPGEGMMITVVLPVNKNV
jgi:signal transduction histidine kinase